MSGKIVSVNTTPVLSEAESTINIPHVKIKDNTRLLPKYSSALSRALEEQLPAEDLDNVQLELESLLSNVALRYRVLKIEFETLDKDDRRIERRNKYEKLFSSPGKRKREESRKPKLPHFKLIKQKINAPHSPVQSQTTDDSMDAVPYFLKEHTKPVLPKNDTPNKFWLSVEPYCMPITNEDLKLLDVLLEHHSRPVVPSIPDLGPHYSTMWAIEEIKNEKLNSNPTSKLRSKHFSTSDGITMLQKGEKIIGECVAGPLTQRLVSALLEENLISDIVSTAEINYSEDLNSTLGSLSLMKNSICIEKRVKRELIEQGILEVEDCTKIEKDEIYSEIKRLTVELTALAEYNKNELKKMHEAACTEIKRLEIKRKLDSNDQVLLEAYKRTFQAKLKKRPLSSDELLELFRLTSEQKVLANKLEKN